MTEASDQGCSPSRERGSRRKAGGQGWQWQEHRGEEKPEYDMTLHPVGSGKPWKVSKQWQDRITT